MKTIETARDILPPGQKAVVFFTRGEKLEIRKDGTGSIGNYKTSTTRLDEMDKVIVYLKEEVNKARIFVGDYEANSPSPQDNRRIIHFSHLKEVGSTDSNWQVFSHSRQSPFVYI